VNRELTLEQLARAVQDWCAAHQVFPANGQAAEAITERNIRYYRTIGLLDAPIGTYTKTFGRKHLLQLIAIRLYQAQGLPLRKIRDELYGKSLEDLTALEKQCRRAGPPALALALAPRVPVAQESWSVFPLAGEFLLMSRRNKDLPRSVIEQINQLLLSVGSENENASDSNRN